VNNQNFIDGLRLRRLINLFWELPLHNSKPF